MAQALFGLQYLKCCQIPLSHLKLDSGVTATDIQMHTLGILRCINCNLLKYKYLATFDPFPQFFYGPTANKLHSLPNHYSKCLKMSDQM